MISCGSSAQVRRRNDYELGRGIQNYVATQMPFGSLLAQIDRLNSPYKRCV